MSVMCVHEKCGINTFRDSIKMLSNMGKKLKWNMSLISILKGRPVAEFPG